VLDRTRDQGHGRVELRTLKVATVPGLGFPHAAQAIQLTRRVRDHASRRWRTVTIYAVTSLTTTQTAPWQLAGYLRGHWTIENGPHWVRDATFAEDAFQVCTGTTPGSGRLRATSPSARCASLGRLTSPPRCDTTAATPPSASHAHESDITAQRRGLPSLSGGRHRRWPLTVLGRQPGMNRSQPPDLSDTDHRRSDLLATVVGEDRIRSVPGWSNFEWQTLRSGGSTRPRRSSCAQQWPESPTGTNEPTAGGPNKTTHSPRRGPALSVRGPTTGTGARS
jgi:hypothetical protein